MEAMTQSLKMLVDKIAKDRYQVPALKKFPGLFDQTPHMPEFLVGRLFYTTFIDLKAADLAFFILSFR